MAYLDLPKRERAQRLAEWARCIGLKPALTERYPSEPGAGILQRIDIGRAIINRPAQIILDEPTSAPDPTARAAIVDLPFQLQREPGTAYLYISHPLSTVGHLSHDVAVPHLWAALEKGMAQEVFTQPRHPYSSVLLASALLPLSGVQQGIGADIALEFARRGANLALTYLDDASVAPGILLSEAPRQAARR